MIIMGRNKCPVLVVVVVVCVLCAAGWWFAPEYIIMGLNVQSAIARPWHDEVLMYKPGNKPYTMSGYAFAGAVELCFIE